MIVFLTFMKVGKPTLHDAKFDFGLQLRRTPTERNSADLQHLNAFVVEFPLDVPFGFEAVYECVK
jgi:hypothetical protein